MSKFFIKVSTATTTDATVFTASTHEQATEVAKTIMRKNEQVTYIKVMEGDFLCWGFSRKDRFCYEQAH